MEWDHILRLPTLDSWVVYANNAPDRFMVGKKAGHTTAPSYVSAATNAYYVRSTDTAGNNLFYTYAGIPGHSDQTGNSGFVAGLPITPYNVTVTYSSSYEFVCAYFRDR